MKKIIYFFTVFLLQVGAFFCCKSAVVAACHLLSRTSGNQINHVVRSSGMFHHPQLCFALFYSSPSNLLVLRCRGLKHM
jgi:hypothetical protein